MYSCRSTPKRRFFIQVDCIYTKKAQVPVSVPKSSFSIYMTASHPQGFSSDVAKLRYFLDIRKYLAKKV